VRNIGLINLYAILLMQITRRSLADEARRWQTVPLSELMELAAHQWVKANADKSRITSQWAGKKQHNATKKA
jgi:hypothetical protein